MNPVLWRELEILFITAVELPEAEQRAYVDAATQGRPDLRRELQSLLVAHVQAGHFLGQPTPAPGCWIGRRVGPYRILREIGRGGMGTVFLADREDQFQKHVAMKIIGSGPMNADLQRRFLEERQILATLEHPNIARLLDGGTTDEGAPYMVMEFVEGVPLTEYSNKQGLGVRARLELFRPVCLAVHFAHQHLIVHRDVKPGNILVTDQGVPVLLDFGIAKVLDPLTSSATTTHAFLQPITPDYASPEQLRGAAVTTASDVYSLGILLYELLTGTRPYSVADTALPEAIRIAEETEPAKPSRQPGIIDPEFSEDLDLIVLKAIRKEPEERYTSAREFAEDITRYLDGFPVTARRNSPGYVIRKLIGRHRLACVSAAVALALIFTGASAVAWEAHVANRERTKAQKRFDELHSLAHSVIFELHDGIARLPGSTNLRKLLVTRALVYLDSLAKDSGGDANLESELVAAYSRIGDVQGKWSMPNLGDRTGALASYHKGLEIAEALRARTPQSEHAVSQAASLYLNIGEIHLGMGDTQRAQKYIKLAVDLLAARRDDAAFAPALLDLYLATRRTDPVTARHHLDQVARIYEARLARDPANQDFQGDVALAHRYLATYYEGAAARPHLTRSLQLDEQRQVAAPADARTRLDVSFDLLEIGHSYLYDRRPDIALSYYTRALAIRQDLAAVDPMNVMARARVAFANLAVARALSATSNPGGAVASARKSVKSFRELTAADPADRQSQYFLVEAYTLLGRNEAKLGHVDLACSDFGQASSTYPLAGSRPRDKYFASWKAEIEAATLRCSKNSVQR